MSRAAHALIVQSVVRSVFGRDASRVKRTRIVAAPIKMKRAVAAANDKDAPAARSHARRAEFSQVAPHKRASSFHVLVLGDLSGIESDYFDAPGNDSGQDRD